MIQVTGGEKNERMKDCWNELLKHTNEKNVAYGTVTITVQGNRTITVYQ